MALKVEAKVVVLGDRSALRDGSAGHLSPAQLGAIDRVLATSNWEIGHVRQVRQIASWLFDALRELHGMGDEDGVLLQAAALLHDVGYPTDPSEHHKVSARIIRTILGPPFSAEQVELIALLARYHRKSLPKLSHRRYSELDPRGRRQVNWLAGILRVADGLDRAHDSGVHWLAASIVHERLEIQVCERPLNSRFSTAFVKGSGRPKTESDRLSADVAGAMRKRDLLERAVGMPSIIHAVS